MVAAMALFQSHSEIFFDIMVSPALICKLSKIVVVCIVRTFFLLGVGCPMLFFEPVDRHTEDSQRDLLHQQTDDGKTISQRDRHTADRQTNRQANIHRENSGRTDRQTNKQPDRQTQDYETDWQTYKQTNDGTTICQRDRHTEDNQTHRQTDTRTPNSGLTKFFWTSE